MRLRRFLFAAALLLAGSSVSAAPSDSMSQPAASRYQPRDADERSIWMMMDEQEQELKDSKFLVTDPALNAYVRSVLCKTVGAVKCAVARIYILRTPYFNAAMAPNGMMMVWTGLLLRTRNEAELATVLGHEFAHFEGRHSLNGFRDIKAKTNALTLLSYLPYNAGIAGQFSLVGSVFSFSRDMERRADLASLDYLAASGYDPMAASHIWRNLGAEMSARADERKLGRLLDPGGGFFSTHPGVSERMDYLQSAAQGKVGPFRDGAAEYRRALQAWWPKLIDDQIKLNDFAATEFLLAQMASDGWTSELLYARGELYRTRGKPGDVDKAIGFYRQAIKLPDAIPESWRGLGIALSRAGKAGDARKAFRSYLEQRPDAVDAALILQMVGK